MRLRETTRSPAFRLHLFWGAILVFVALVAVFTRGGILYGGVLGLCLGAGEGCFFLGWDVDYRDAVSAGDVLFSGFDRNVFPETLWLPGMTEEYLFHLPFWLIITVLVGFWIFAIRKAGKA